MEQDIDVRPLSGALGAEVHGIDLKRPLTGNLRAAVHNALWNHLVLFFPGQQLNTSEFKSFGESWDKLVVYPTAPSAKADPDVVEHVASRGDVADMWHTDLTWQRDPAKIAVLSMVKAPPVGGDTMWSNQYAAYEHLSEPIRNLVDGLTAIHRFPRELVRPDRPASLEGVEHPVVRVHPETGRRALFVNQMYTARIPQLSRGESDALLNFLFAHSVDPRFTVRYRWSEGTVAVWDNRCTQHMVVNDFVGERVINRVTAGSYPYETIQPAWADYQAGRASLTAKLDTLGAEA